MSMGEGHLEDYLIEQDLTGPAWDMHHFLLGPDVEEVMSKFPSQRT